MVRLAHTLGMVVVAEGVETADQLMELTDLGVDLAQGFYLGRPVDAGTFSEMLTLVPPAVSGHVGGGLFPGKP
jgi:EAL domain-containing protein (putative c-di-GMP-specific phosphodiesterase class I)